MAWNELTLGRLPFRASARSVAGRRGRPLVAARSRSRSRRRAKQAALDHVEQVLTDSRRSAIEALRPHGVGRLHIRLKAQPPAPSIIADQRERPPASRSQRRHSISWFAGSSFAGSWSRWCSSSGSTAPQRAQRPPCAAVRRARRCWLRRPRIRPGSAGRGWHAGQQDPESISWRHPRHLHFIADHRMD